MGLLTGQSSADRIPRVIFAGSSTVTELFADTGEDTVDSLSEIQQSVLNLILSGSVD